MKQTISVLSKDKLIHYLRFIVVGVLNTSFSFMIYSLFIYAGLEYKLANFLSLVIGIVFSFKTQGTLVFGNKSNKLFGRFLISWILIYFCSITITGWFIDLGYNAYIAGAFALPPTIIFSYLTQRFFVFSKPVLDN